MLHASLPAVAYSVTSIRFMGERKDRIGGRRVGKGLGKTGVH